jgi:H+/Cl- antiporter ClcA
MGFWAYLLLGSLMGWAVAHYFPGFSPKNRGKRAERTKATYIWSIFSGIFGAVLTSYFGQFMGLFSSGQMLEWASVIFGAFFLSNFYIALKIK